MPLQDLTPQLRTRLNRMERAVGWFLIIATLLLLAGIGYYLYKAAETRGWFKIKAPFFIYTERADGLAIGNKVYMIGFEVGHITGIKMMAPTYGKATSNNVLITFEVEEPNFAYIWTESSTVQIKSAFLGGRMVDISKGLFGHVTYLRNGFRDDMTLNDLKSMEHPENWRLGEDLLDGTNVVLGAWKPLTNMDILTRWVGERTFCAINAKDPKKEITAVWNPTNHAYEKFFKTNIYELHTYEEPDVQNRLNAMVAQIQAALPGILDLTNKLGGVLSNATKLTDNLNGIAAGARPAVSNLTGITQNLTAITENLRNPNGSLGQWVIPTNLNEKLNNTVETVNTALTNLDTNLLTLNRTLDNLGNITSNLNNQVQANPHILSNLSDTVVHSDQFIQGLKRFWLFRHLFTAHTGEPKGLPSAKTESQRREPVVAPK